MAIYISNKEWDNLSELDMVIHEYVGDANYTIKWAKDGAWLCLMG